MRTSGIRCSGMNAGKPRPRRPSFAWNSASLIPLIVSRLPRRMTTASTSSPSLCSRTSLVKSVRSLGTGLPANSSRMSFLRMPAFSAGESGCTSSNDEPLVGRQVQLIDDDRRRHLHDGAEARSDHGRHSPATKRVGRCDAAELTADVFESATEGVEGRPAGSDRSSEAPGLPGRSGRSSRVP